jgi:Hint domain
MPIRVARFAIDDHAPHSDLYLSPGHCIFFNEALIPVMYLINEASITQGTPSDMSALECYHIELDTHEVIYAEGALVESFDGSDREIFSNFVQYERLYGGKHQSKMTPFAPILQIRWPTPGVEGPCKVFNFQRCRRPRSDPNCLRSACQAHLAIFLSVGIAFGAGYPDRPRAVAIGLAGFSGAIEIAQLWIPGRHARLIHFLVDTTTWAMQLF